VAVAPAAPIISLPLEALTLIEDPITPAATATPTNAAPLDHPLLIEGPTPSATAPAATTMLTGAAPLDAPLLIEGPTPSAASAFEALSAPPTLVPLQTCAGLAPTPAPPTPEAKPAPAPPVSRAVPRGPDEHVHRERLRQSTSARAQRRRVERRDQTWQREQRERERLVRAEAAAQASVWQDQGVPAREIANLLDCPARTLRYWQHQLETDRLQAPPLGRPHLHCTVEQSQEVIRFLHGHGPWVGMPTLTGAFVGLPAAELRDLLRVFRHLWVGQHPRQRSVLHWHQVGSAWAMDFTKVQSPVDGIYPYVFAVRDLASGQQVAWRPVQDMEAATAQAELKLLFTIHGAPLVMKSDNGSAFLAAATKRFLGRWQVWPLYSPPGEPSYNGSIEASIGSLKKRTQHAAYLAGHAGEWTTSDLDRARELANLVARPRGARGPTPQQLWETRRPPTMEQRAAFGAAIRQLEAQFRARDGIALEAELKHYEQAALHRRVLQQVLVECGLLTITRRRIPQTFYGQKVANIT
jgi:transposase InsO family protein